MSEIIFLKPVLKEVIWGGQRLKSEYHYDVQGQNAGECWGIAAHEHGDNEILNGRYQGKTLSWLWAEHRECFGGLSGERFPLLVKIIDAAADLSIQVHPDDVYAKEHEHGSTGKTECWYIIDCDEDAQIVIGHHAKTRDELLSQMEHEKWDELIRVLPIHKGDFFQINPGCVHAIKQGTLILETQQNSDITYRMYDYGRLQNGKPRELHVSRCGEVVTVPHQDAEVHPVETRDMDCIKIRYIECPYYTVERWELDGEYQFAMKQPFMNVSVMEGSGMVNGHRIAKGIHFLIPADITEVKLEGNMELMCSWCGEQEIG